MLEIEMATIHLSASTISTKWFASFEGLRSSNSVKVASLKQNGGFDRSFRFLVVKAATTVAPKVLFLPATIITSNSC